MKKFLSLCAAFVCACTMSAGVVTFSPGDFSGQGTEKTGSEVTATKSGVTLTCDKAYGAGSALRCYQGANLSITSESNISTIELSFETQNGRTYDGGLTSPITVNATSWTPDALASQARLTQVKVNIAGDVEEDPVDTISVSQALARLADPQGNKGECYVKGKVLSIITNNVEQYGNISYWMADFDTPTDSLQAFRMKGANNADYPNAAAIEFVEGDEILVYAAGLAMYHNNNTGQDIPELNTGYYVRTISGADIVNLDWSFGNAYRSAGKWALEIEKVAGQAANVLRLEFSSDQETSIAGYHTLETGSAITLEGTNTAVTGSVKLTFKEINDNSLNVYSVMVSAVAGDKAYRLNKDIEFYAQDGDGDEIVLIGDRPFTPKDGDTITCAQAREYTLSLGSGESSTVTVTVRGFVTDMFDNGVTFWMDDKQGSEKTIQAYSCTMPTGVSVVDGTEVFVTGKLKNYGGSTPEIDHGAVTVISGAGELTIISVSVAEAIAACQALEQNKVSAETYAITGYISGIVTEYSEQYGNISFWMSDQADDAQNFQAYRAKCDAATAAKLVKGALVRVTDKLKHFHQDAKPAEGEQEAKPERTVYETNGGGTVEMATGVVEIISATPAVKVLENGQIYIIRGGVRYNLQGQIAE